MTKVFLKGLKIKKPDYNLGKTQIGEMIDAIIPILKKEKPNYVLVIGDTNSSLAGAIAAEQAGIKVIHLEAGLRSFDTSMIEERNRIMIDYASDILLCPTEKALSNLMDEKREVISYNVGAAQCSNMLRTFPLDKPENAYQYCVATIHRDFNVDDKKRLTWIVEALNESGEDIIFPMHPRTKKMMKEFKLKFNNNVKVIDPVGYKEMLTLTSWAKKIITDSGGIVPEMYFLRRPCIIVRPNTEWTEAVDEGWAILVNHKQDLLKQIKNFNKNLWETNNMAYGNGQTFDLVQSLINGLK